MKSEHVRGAFPVGAFAFLTGLQEDGSAVTWILLHGEIGLLCCIDPAPPEVLMPDDATGWLGREERTYVLAASDQPAWSLVRWRMGHGPPQDWSGGASLIAAQDASAISPALCTVTVAGMCYPEVWGDGWEAAEMELNVISRPPAGALES